MKKILILCFVLLISTSVNAYECNSTTECLVKGKTVLQQKDYKGAKQLFYSALFYDSQNFIAYAYLAKTSFYLKKYDDSMSFATKSLEIRPNSIAYGVRGSSKLALNNVKGAIEDTTSALELNPEYMKCYEVRARAEVLSKEYIDAMKDITKALELNQNYPKSYEVRALAYMGLQDYRSAIMDFEKAQNLFKLNGDKKNYNKMQKQISVCNRYLK